MGPRGRRCLVSTPPDGVSCRPPAFAGPSRLLHTQLGSTTLFWHSHCALYRSVGLWPPWLCRAAGRWIFEAAAGGRSHCPAPVTTQGIQNVGPHSSAYPCVLRRRTDAPFAIAKVALGSLRNQRILKAAQKCHGITLSPHRHRQPISPFSEAIFTLSTAFFSFLLPKNSHIWLQNVAPRAVPDTGLNFW